LIGLLSGRYLEISDQTDKPQFLHVRNAIFAKPVELIWNRVRSAKEAGSVTGRLRRRVILLLFNRDRIPQRGSHAPRV
jgi:hypothetical protein